MADTGDFNAIRISLASPEQIRAWSFGEVKSPDTMNYRTLRPEKDGLFCERIFGPVRDWTCACGNYRRARFQGTVCEKCGVEVTSSRVRRERMGHIELACPVAHLWYAKGSPSRMALLLGLAPRNLERVLSFGLHVITHVDEEARRLELARLDEEIARIGLSHGDASGDELKHLAELRAARRDVEDVQRLGLLDEQRYRELAPAYGHLFRAGMGAEAVGELLGGLDLEALSAELRDEIRTADAQGRTRATKRLKVVESFRSSHLSPQWMILSVLPVLPPDLRPILQLDGGCFASSDLNDLYRHVIHRNNRVRRMKAVGAPEIIVRNEKRLLQEAVDALIDNGHRRRPLLGASRRPLKSLSDILRGKQGRFRRNLLGKRVDYSGRSVISAGLDLKLHQCGLPLKVALELFKPFVMRRLVERGMAPTVRGAKRLVERRRPEVWDVLEEVMIGSYVLLNRAPTLHRLSIQAFEPVLVEGNAIRLHPLVCSAFNADFDGDQMAVHLPLSDAAQREAMGLMLSTQNLLHPATGEPAISVSQDMVLGLFYLTQERPGKKGEGRVFSTTTEALLAFERGVLDLQARIGVRLQVQAGANTPPAPPAVGRRGALIETTVGRVIFNEVLPERLGYKNYEMKKEHLKQIVAECYKECGPATTAELADELKRLGFAMATRAGISIAMSDFSVPAGKPAEIAKGDASVAELEAQFREGLMTPEELSLGKVAIWNRVTDDVTRLVEAELDPYGAVATISKSGATKAKFQQIRQLVGMRGLMASMSGKIIDMPIRGNYYEGLTVAESLIGSYGARKSMADRPLQTANSGYLTRRLVEAGMEVIVTVQDCGTAESLTITDQESREMGLPDMRNRLVSRVLAEAIPGFEQVPVGTELTDDLAVAIVSAGVTQVAVRSPLCCRARRGICRMCYGRDLATNSLVRVGAAVGIVAGQSIGEPGTQLTMRTFHSGGIAGAQGDITQGLPRVEELFEARTPRAKATIGEIDGVVEIGKGEEKGGRTVRVVSTAPVFDDYPLPAAGRVLVREGSQVVQGQVLAMCGAGIGVAQGAVLARSPGEVVSVAGDRLTLRCGDRDERTYELPPGRKLVVSAGQQVAAGMPLTDGPLDPRDILRMGGRATAAAYLVKEVQRVYRTTGVYIHDKHMEVIIRQMLRRVVVEEQGDTDLLPGALLDASVYEAANTRALVQGGEPAMARPVLLGISKATLATESWLVAASFVETSRILTEAAIEGRIDHLVGVKENVIIGKLIPAGTGHVCVGVELSYPVQN